MHIIVAKITSFEQATISEYRTIHLSKNLLRFYMVIQGHVAIYRFRHISNNQKDTLATCILSHSDKTIPMSATIDIHFSHDHFSLDLCLLF